MTYLIVLGVAFLAVGIATPLTLITLRMLDKPTPTPPAQPAPAPEALSGPERVDRLSRRGRR